MCLSLGKCLRDVQNIPVVFVIFKNYHTIVHCDFDYCFSVGFNNTQLLKRVFLLSRRYWMEGYSM